MGEVSLSARVLLNTSDEYVYSDLHQMQRQASVINVITNIPHKLITVVSLHLAVLLSH